MDKTYLKYKPEFTRDEEATIMKVFTLFADKNGVAYPGDIAASMKELKYNETDNPIYTLIAELDETDLKNGMTFEQFINALNGKLQDRGNPHECERGFELFTGVPKGLVTAEVLKRVSDEVGENAPMEEIQKRISIAAENQKDIDIAEFTDIMLKNISLK